MERMNYDNTSCKRIKLSAKQGKDATMMQAVKEYPDYVDQFCCVFKILPCLVPNWSEFPDYEDEIISIFSTVDNSVQDDNIECEEQRAESDIHTTSSNNIVLLKNLDISTENCYSMIYEDEHCVAYEQKQRSSHTTTSVQQTHSIIQHRNLDDGLTDQHGNLGNGVTDHLSGFNVIDTDLLQQDENPCDTSNVRNLLLPQIDDLSENANENNELETSTETDLRDKYQKQFEEKMKDLDWFICDFCQEISMCRKSSYKGCAHGKACFKFSAQNNMDPGEQPFELQELTYVEEQLIAQIHPVISVYKVKGHQYAYSGNVINFPQDVFVFAKKLPHKISDLNNIIKIRKEFNGNHRDFFVRADKVKNALLWLKENNHEYFDIEISEENLNLLPVNGNVFSEISCLESDDKSDEQIGLNVEDGSSNEMDVPIQDIDKVLNELETSTSEYFSVPLVTVPSQADQLKNLLKWPDMASTPISEFKNPGYIVKAFPCLFPTGKADLYDVRNDNINASDYFAHLMNYKDRRFALHPLFRFFAFNSLMRWRAISDGSFYVNKNIDLKDLNANQLKNKLNQDPNFLKKIMFQSSNLRGTRSYWFGKMNQLVSMVEQIGPPTLFITLSFADLHVPDLFRLLAPNVDLSTLTDEHRKKLVQDHPMIVDAFFMERVETFVKDVLIPKFEMTDYWYRVEFQHRGSPHIHGVFWLKDAPNIIDLKNASDEVKEEIKKYFDCLICCVNPNMNEEMADIHPCQVRLEDVKNLQKDLAQLLNKVQRHTKCSEEYCLRENKVTKVKECRFKFPLQMEPCSRWEIDDKGEIQYVGERNDPLLNKFNQYIIQLWRANIDISPITCLKDLYRYLTKYIAKSETQSKHLIDLINEVFSECNENTPIRSVIQKLYIKCCSERDYGSQEVCHLLMNLKLVSCSGRQFVTINTKTLSTDWQLFLLDDNKKGKSFIEKYIDRTDNLENCSLWEAAKCIIFPSERKRHKEAIVLLYPNLRKFEDEESEDYCRQQVLLHVPWRNEKSFLQHNSTWKDVYLEHKDIIKQNATATKFEKIQDDESENIEQTEEDTSLTETEWMAVSKMKPTTLPNTVSLGLREIDLLYDWKEQQQFYCQFGDMTSISQFISREKKKEQSMEDTVFPNIIFNEQQEKVLKLVDEQIDFYKSGSNMNDYSIRKRIIIQGRAGTGKSVLIDAVKSKLTSAFGNDCFKTVASTGVAAVQIGGNTLYSELHIPHQIQNYNPLKGTALKEFNLTMENVKFLLIDEYSMIGTTLLAYAHKRCQEGKSNFSEDFGGLCIFMFGDINQLPPVSDSPLYADKQNSMMNKIGKAVFDNFDCSVILTQIQRQSDPTFQRVLNNISNGQVTDLDYQVLKRRFTTAVSRIEKESFNNAIHLFGKREEVLKCNTKYLENLREINTNNPLPIIRIEAKHNNSAAKTGTSEDAQSLEPILYLSRGCKIMLRFNLWTSKGLVNGATGIVVDILFHENASYPDSTPMVLICHFDNYKGPYLAKLSNYNLVPISMVTKQWKNKDGILCSRTQFPVNLAHACTIHKSQGLTLSKVCVDLGDSDFALGMTYVALSRSKTLEGLLLAPFNEQRILKLNRSKALQIRKQAEVKLVSKSIN